MKKSLLRWEYIPLILLAIFYLMPLYVMLVTGFKSFAEVDLATIVCHLSQSRKVRKAFLKFLHSGHFEWSGKRDDILFLLISRIRLQCHEVKLAFLMRLKS